MDEEVTNVFPFDYSSTFEVAQSARDSKHDPILFIPGVCGTKLIAKNRKTNQADYAWLNTSYVPFSIASKLAQYLWGTIDDDLNFKSYVDEYAEIYTIPGVKGCDKLLDIGILDSKYLENVNIGKYFGPMIQNLVKNYGYQIGIDIFAFSYDWRQSPANASIYRSVTQLIREICQLSGKKVTIVAHSMGGIVVDCYMKLHPDFTRYVGKFIALAVPFDGCGGFSLEALMLGYCLKLPLHRCAAKGIQAIGGCAACLHQRPTGKAPATPCIYIKKLQEPENSESSTFQRMKETVMNTVNQLRSSPYIVESIEFDALVFGDEIPDVCFCIAQRLYQTCGLDIYNAYQTYRKLQYASKRGSIVINGELAKLGPSYLMILPDQALEPNFIKCSEYDFERGDFRWECYSVWSDFPGIDRKYHFAHNYVEFGESSAKFPRKLFRLIENGIKDIYEETEELRLGDFAQALQFHREFLQKQEPVPENLKRQPMSVSACIGRQPTGGYGPWSSKEGREAVYEQSVFELLQKVHQTDTLEGFLYTVRREIYQQLADVRSKSLNVPHDCGFRFYSLSGYGVDTPLHLVYSKPVFDYAELQIQKPEYIMADGDGTVFLTGALGDEFDDAISRRVAVRGMGHFPMITDPRMWDVVIAWLYE